MAWREATCTKMDSDIWAAAASVVAVEPWAQTCRCSIDAATNQTNDSYRSVSSAACSRTRTHRETATGHLRIDSGR